VTASLARAVIFDMDGVLTDSEPAFHAAVNDMLARYGNHLSLRDYARYIGMATPVMWSQVIERFALPVSLDDMVEQYEAPLMQRLREPRPALPGARELLEALEARGVPFALCTASYRRWVDAILPSAGLAGRFGAIVAGDDVTCTKPDPEPYVRAAQLLGEPPARCLVLEDSASGMTSALGAGCPVAQVRATSTAAAPMPGVARVIDALSEFPWDLVGGQ
jgi:HAD superfamily hydrolase (TIGR01509 family)